MSICGTFKTTDVSTNDVDNVVAIYQATVPAPVRVDKKQDAPNSWTVTAVWPPCPQNTSHSTNNST
jgi:hypothetical protein